MIEYRKYILDNGLTLLTHEAWDTPLASLNVLYGVGSRDEEPHRTGLAHLLEHLMFGGTRKVPDFDAVVSGLGGESNAFTGCDCTNYYMTVPAGALATALALEADRMTGFEVTAESLAVQQKVVTEEYHQRYSNQPYGDVWKLLRPLCYKVYPYRWETIGADIRHVGEATLEDVRAFHRRHYRPDNAVLAVAAPMSHDAMAACVAEAWGVPLPTQMDDDERPSGMADGPDIVEPEQTEARELRVERDVPSTKLYLAYPMCDRTSPYYRACDLLSDVLGNGNSSRLFRRLVMEEGLMTEADAFISGDTGPGLLVLSGVPAEGVDAERAMAALRAEAERLAAEEVDAYELQKVQNKYENTFVFSQYRPSDRALGLCWYTWQGDTGMVNREPEEYRRVTPQLLREAARQTFRGERENRLYYQRRNS